MTEQKPLVGIVMGSTSDWPLMQNTAKTLESFGVPYEVRVLSAHRTPDEALEYSATAADRGLACIIAGAGGAAHLAGVAAGLTTLPVIAVPMPTKHLGGLDSLLSMVQMPTGIPVATVAIGGAKNAGILAAEILALGDDALAAKLDAYRQEQADKIRNTVI
jgi:5-(carboxyamino)imidazole ribonucleotide mutase